MKDPKVSTIIPNRGGIDFLLHEGEVLLLRQAEEDGTEDLIEVQGADDVRRLAHALLHLAERWDAE